MAGGGFSWAPLQTPVTEGFEERSERCSPPVFGSIPTGAAEQTSAHALQGANPVSRGEDWPGLPMWKPLGATKYLQCLLWNYISLITLASFRVVVVVVFSKKKVWSFLLYELKCAWTEWLLYSCFFDLVCCLLFITLMVTLFLILCLKLPWEEGCHPEVMICSPSVGTGASCPWGWGVIWSLPQPPCNELLSASFF